MSMCDFVLFDGCLSYKLNIQIDSILLVLPKLFPRTHLNESYTKNKQRPTTELTHWNGHLGWGGVGRGVNQCKTAFIFNAKIISL